MKRVRIYPRKRVAARRRAQCGPREPEARTAGADAPALAAGGRRAERAAPGRCGRGRRRQPERHRSRELVQPRPTGHSGLGLAPGADRVPGRRGVDLGAGADQFLAGDVRDLSAAGLAPRRRRGARGGAASAPPSRSAGGSASGISSPGSIGSATPSWSMPRRSAGCCRSRSRRCRPGLAVFTGLGVALARLLWTPGPFRILTLAAALDGGRMAARPRADRISLERVRLCADDAAAARPERRRSFGIWGLTFIAVAVFASPAVLADDVRETRRPWLPVAVRRPRAGGACGLRRDPARAQSDRARGRRAAADHAAQRAAGREIQLRRQAARS